jgi:hypothetical protein
MQSVETAAATTTDYINSRTIAFQFFHFTAIPDVGVQLIVQYGKLREQQQLIVDYPGYHKYSLQQQQQ